MLAVAVALAAAVAPLPAAWVERVYSRGLYPRIQSIVTPVSALTSIALLDGAVAILLTTALYSSSAGHARTARVRRSSERLRRAP